jgi:hypothetical protein
VRPTGAVGIDGRQALLACDVLRALCDVTCLAGNVLDEYDFGDTIRGNAAHDDDPYSTADVELPLGTEIEVKVRPVCTCVMCASPICDASRLKQMDTYEEKFRDVSVCRRCLSDCKAPRAARYLNPDGTTTIDSATLVDCGYCLFPAPCTQRKRRLRVWAARVDVRLKGHHRDEMDGEYDTEYEYSEYVKYSNAIEVVQADTPVPAYFAECAAVPCAMRSIWQQMACEAHAAEEMLLAAFQPGPLNLERALLSKSDSKLKLLSLEHVLIILRHLQSAVLPPSRKQLLRR